MKVSLRSDVAWFLILNVDYPVCFNYVCMKFDT